MSYKILAYTVFDNKFESLKDLVIPNNKQYFDTYSIEYVVSEGDAKDIFNIDYDKTSYINYFTKFLLLDKLLKERKDIDYFFMMDCDIVICNKKIELDYIINMSDNKDILICSAENCSKDMFWNVNSGSIIFKNSQKTRYFLDIYLNYAKSNSFHIYDQPLLQALLRQESFQEIFCIYPPSAFNHGDKNSFLFHACRNSTSNQNFENAIEKKVHDIKNILESL